jgi:hypothetical protein
LHFPQAKTPFLVQAAESGAAFAQAGMFLESVVIVIYWSNRSPWVVGGSGELDVVLEFLV